MNNDHKIFRSLWFMWLVTTGLYIILTLVGGLSETPSPIGHITGFVGLFVPYGLLSLILLMSPYTWASLVVFILFMVFVEKYLNTLNISFEKRLLLNLLALLILTFAVDGIRQTPLESWRIFIHGAYSHYCC